MISSLLGLIKERRCGFTVDMVSALFNNDEEKIAAGSWELLAKLQ
jgi:hypothetical protein